MRYFGTLFNINYLNRGLSLLDSLQKQVPEFKLFILCLDVQTFEYLTTKNDSNIIAIPLSDLEDYFIELKTAKENRSIVEYFFTLSPALPLYILKKYPEIPLITTLDADIYIYSSLEPVFEEMGDNSVLISPHRFPEILKHKEIYGLYNVSFQSFKNDLIGISCLTKWYKQCVDWCFDKLEDKKFADQLYLNTWIEEFEKVKVIENIGAAVAPWNLGNHTFSYSQNQIKIDDNPLVFYHFHGVKFISDTIVLHNLNEYDLYPNELVVKYLYGPYILSLSKYSTQSAVSHQNIRYNFSTIWKIKRILKGGALKLEKNKEVVLLNKSFYKIFVMLKNLLSKN